MIESPMIKVDGPDTGRSGADGAACSGCPEIAEQGRLPEHLRRRAPGSDNCRGARWTATGSAGWTGGTVTKITVYIATGCNIFT